MGPWPRNVLNDWQHPLLPVLLFFLLFFFLFGFTNKIMAPLVEGIFFPPKVNQEIPRKLNYTYLP